MMPRPLQEHDMALEPSGGTKLLVERRALGEAQLVGEVASQNGIGRVETVHALVDRGSRKPPIWRFGPLPLPRGEREPERGQRAADMQFHRLDRDPQRRGNLTVRELVIAAQLKDLPRPWRQRRNRTGNGQS